MDTQIIERKDTSVFGCVESFETAQRMGKMLAQSKLIPVAFQNKIEDCVIALEIARRIGASPLMVMQNMHIIHGKPSWSSTFVIAAVNSCGKFSPLRFAFTDDRQACFAWANELSTGERLEGPQVSIQMAKNEGWYGKSGSKWQSMPELMLRYRAATFFGRLYAPEILMGMRPMDEIADIEASKGNKKAWDIEIESEPQPKSETNPLKSMAEEIVVEPVPVDRVVYDDKTKNELWKKANPQMKTRFCRNFGENKDEWTDQVWELLEAEVATYMEDAI